MRHWSFLPADDVLLIYPKMMPHSPAFHVYQGLPRFASIALGVFVISSAAVAQPRASGRRTAPPVMEKVNSSPHKRPAQLRPDPRYRPPRNFAELQAVAADVARASGREIRWRLALGKAPGPFAKISGSIDNCTIAIHPVAARTVPPNTWAFVIAHELAHRVENLGDYSRTTPANELQADIVGARYAMAAGYHLEAFLGWVLSEPDGTSHSHGSTHARVHAIAAHFHIPDTVLQAETHRYIAYREKY